MPVVATGGQSIKVVVPSAPVPSQVTIVRGPEGPPGPPGPAGPPGGALFVHDQTTPANPWIIEHNLNRFPHVTLIMNDIAVEADVSYGDLNHVTISFPNPSTGKAVIS